MPRPKGRRLRRLAGRRWVAVAALVLVALLYYRPLHAYLDARGQRAERAQDVQRLRDEQATLERRLKASSSLTVLAREARALGYVRPGEHLFVVRNIPAWRRAQRPAAAGRR